MARALIERAIGAGRALQQNPVYVIGIGMHRYQFASETPYVPMGLTAVREALADARVAWPQVQAAYVGTSAIGMATGRVMLRHLGSTGLAVTQVESASASGCAAFRQACLDVAAGESDIALALGVDKPGDSRRAADKDGLGRLSPTANIPAVKFALMARGYLARYGLPVEAMARVAVKNHGNAALNPYAQFRKPRTLEQVLGSPKVVGDLTVQQCCPRGEGAAAVIVASGAALDRLGYPKARAVRVLASVATSETLGTETEPPAEELVRTSTELAYAQAGIGAADLDLIELHEAFSIEELIYTEAMGLCAPGEGAACLADGATQIGGRCAVNASGGLLGMGHPIGPTGVGQVAEITRQIRGEAAGRQHPNARVGLAHMIGLGSVAFAHVLAGWRDAT
ncbi:thiolase family protein [Verticiella sediminum]|uniref:Thiolase family protein n=1 Tax=Verticiella sediminum TaxID=1247510 RepID=A0A556AWJ9_9BURK|nr:thiolase family protein [Verticiella sediminum]TSH97319.1 thiolase family protein [Verticiella sediminum]